MNALLLATAIGFVSGVLSGAFGIGGGIITTPAIRLLMNAPALIAVGTPLPVILPSALTGSVQYHRAGRADVRSGIVVGLSGAVTAVLGAWLTRLAGGTTVLLGTAALIVWAAGDMLAQVVRPPKSRPDIDAGADAPNARPTTRSLVAIGLVTGIYSGFFGLGGGFIVVPMLSRWLHFPIKRAIGTSLVAVTLLSVPGTITHSLMGNIDWSMVLGLTVGVVPGAFVGSRVSLGASDRAVRIGFALLLLFAAAWLALNEIARFAS